MMETHLQLIEIFRSVQGETSLSGLPTTFVRLAACNLRCTWCDTTYSFGRGKRFSFEEILETVTKFGCRCVCITGGEPLLQPQVRVLMQRLCNLGYTVSLETSGSLSTEGIDPRVKVILDVKCPGSGMEKHNLWDNIARLQQRDEVKFVVADQTDYTYAKAVIREHALPDRVSEILLSPVHGMLDSKELVGWILEDQLPVRLNLQIHKYIWSPTTQGV